MPVHLRIDMSLPEAHSGAAFTIEARDLNHARSIVDWLSRRFPDFQGASVRVPVVHEDFLARTKTEG